MKKRMIFAVCLLAIMLLAVSCARLNIKYVLEFDSNGGSSCGTVKSEDIDSVKVPDDPTRENYTFGGWFWDKDSWQKPFTVNSILDQPILSNMNMKVYAKWVGVDVKVTLKADGGDQTVTIEYGADFTLDVPQRAGADFLGWAKKGDIITYVTDKFGNSLAPCDFLKATLVPMFDDSPASPANIVIRFDGNGQTDGHMSAESYTTSTVTLPDVAFAKTGHYFIGWTCDGKDYTDGQTVTLPDGNYLFVAKWAASSYTARFERGAEGVSGSMQSKTYTYGKGEPLPPCAFTRTGYSFGGWVYNGRTYQAGAKVHLTDENGATVVLTASWKPIKYRVYFKKSADASKHDSKYVDLEYDQYYGVPVECEKAGYTLSGWNYGDIHYNKGDRVYNLTAQNGAEVELVASWAPIEYVISFRSANGMTYQQYNTYNVKFDQTVEVIDQPGLMTKEGYDFECWQLWGDSVIEELRGKKYYPGDTVEGLTYRENASVYFAAVWSPVTYTVNLMHDYGSDGKVSAQKVYAEDKAILLDDFPQKQDHTLGGFAVGYEFENVTRSAVYLTLDYCTRSGGTVNMYPMWLYNYTGSGTASDPYIVDCPAAMENMAIATYLKHAAERTTNGQVKRQADVHFLFTRDIDMSGRTFTPIGIYGHGEMTGVIDGNNHTVTNLNIRVPDGIQNPTQVGFVCDNWGTVKNLRFEGGSLDVTVNTKSDVWVAFVVAQSYRHFLQNVSVRGVTIRANQLGDGKLTVSGMDAHEIGLYSDMSNCYFSGTVNVTAAFHSVLYIVGSSASHTACANIVTATVSAPNIRLTAISAENSYSVFTVNLTVEKAENFKFDQQYEGSAHSYYSDTSSVTLNSQPYALTAPGKTADSNLKDADWITQNLPIMRTTLWNMAGGYPELGGRTLDTVQITSKEQFVALGGKALTDRYVLGCDIDMTDTAWTSADVFGEFDGGGHTISGLSITVTDGSYAALFGNNYGVIKNLVVDNAALTAYTQRKNAYASGAVVRNYGTVAYVKVSGTITAKATWSGGYAGGIASINEGEIYCCYTNCTINVSGISEKLTGTSPNAPYAYAYGIAYNSRNGTVTGCYSLGTITAHSEEENSSGYMPAVYMAGVANTATACFSTANLTYNKVYNTKVFAVADGLKACSEQTINGATQSGGVPLAVLKTESYLTATLGFFKYQTDLDQNKYAAWVFAQNAFPTLYFENI